MNCSVYDDDGVEDAIKSNTAVEDEELRLEDIQINGGGRLWWSCGMMAEDE